MQCTIIYRAGKVQTNRRLSGDSQFRRTFVRPVELIKNGSQSNKQQDHMGRIAFVLVEQ